ncbi:arsenate reductase ArsC, partial [Rhizobium ruizarguesonis]
LKNRIIAFFSLPLSSIDKLALESHLRQIGTMEVASIKQPNAS